MVGTQRHGDLRKLPACCSRDEDMIRAAIATSWLTRRFDIRLVVYTGSYIQTMKWLPWYDIVNVVAQKASQLLFYLYVDVFVLYTCWWIYVSNTVVIQKLLHLFIQLSRHILNAFSLFFTISTSTLSGNINSSRCFVVSSDMPLCFTCLNTLVSFGSWICAINVRLTCTLTKDDTICWCYCNFVCKLCLRLKMFLSFGKRKANTDQP